MATLIPETAAHACPPRGAAAAPPPPDATGGGGVNLTSWVERYIARREAARAFLTEAGHVVQPTDALNAFRAVGAAIPTFRVSGYPGLVFHNEDLVALAVHLGWEG